MPIETWLIFTVSFMIAGSIIALELKDILSSIVAIGIVGLGLSVAFLFLQAPDLAIVQFLFEIFALIILVRAFIRKEVHDETPARVHGALVFGAILVLLIILMMTIPVLKLLPPFGEPLMETAQHYINSGAEETGATNLVTSIILDYRAYDTLGEITVLFTAILGVITVLRIRQMKRKKA